jgi:hypothetical protein
MVLTSFTLRERNVRGEGRIYFQETKEDRGINLLSSFFVICLYANVLAIGDNERSWRGDILSLSLNIPQAGIHVRVTEPLRHQLFWERRVFGAHILVEQVATRDHCAS